MICRGCVTVYRAVDINKIISASYEGIEYQPTQTIGTSDGWVIKLEKSEWFIKKCPKCAGQKERKE